RRVYATGMSNGGMMCYRLAAELSDRIAAVAPVSGTQAIEEGNPKRPVHPRTAMAAMRHSRMELTMNFYTDPVLLDVAGPV
ncbi:MAG: hypothetical protein NTV86_10115, partial [Planctomycetota bacterium]|nr:hypothetical protein [Planctomycetota bacterium]